MKRTCDPDVMATFPWKHLVDGKTTDLPLPVEPTPIDSKTFSLDHESGSDSDSDSGDSDGSDGTDGTDGDGPDKPDLDGALFTILSALTCRYVFLSEIDSNPSTFIFSAADMSTGRRVAIKIQAKNTQKSDPMEVRCLSKVQNIPTCQRLETYFRFPNGFAIVTPLYVEHSIRKTIWESDRRLALTQVYMKQLLTAIAAIHEQGVVHRDIKPGNVMWNSDNATLVLIDFGMASFTNRSHTRSLGTEGYESQEVRAGTHYNESTDIFSAGVILGQFIFKVRECDTSYGMLKRWRNKKVGKIWIPAQRLMKAMTEPQAKRISLKDAFASDFFAV